MLRSDERVHGAGHHCIVWSPDEKDMFILYHQHCDLEHANPRKLSIDRIRFERDEKGEEILVVDGPTAAPQPYFWDS